MAASKPVRATGNDSGAPAPDTTAEAPAAPAEDGTAKILAAMSQYQNHNEDKMAELFERLNRVEEAHDTMHAGLHDTGPNQNADAMHDMRMQDDIYEEAGVLSLNQLPRRPGFARRWVRTAQGNESDANNVYRQMNRGWKPVLKSEVPKDVLVPCIAHGDQDVVGVYGNILMERPIEVHEKYTRSARRQGENQDLAVRTQLHTVHDSSQAGLGRPQMDRQSTSEVSRRQPADDSGE